MNKLNNSNLTKSFFVETFLYSFLLEMKANINIKKKLLKCFYTTLKFLFISNSKLL